MGHVGDESEERERVEKKESIDRIVTTKLIIFWWVFLSIV
jgi:hypothetical protein